MNILPLKAVSPWRLILRQNFTRIEALADFLALTEEQRFAVCSRPRFALNVPLRIAQKMCKGTLDDPLVRQFLPLAEEEVQHTLYSKDPIGDQCSRQEAKLLQKYEGRVLLVCTSACAMHCRYCFRQHFDYDCQDKTFAAELALIARDTSVHEVILSGGDPLSLSDETLESLLMQLSSMSHIKRIRFHTRFPIGIPERIDDSFLEMLSKISKQLIFIIHVNHPRELDTDVLDSLKALQKLGCPVLNQAVLLKGVNDDLATLKALSEKLVDHGVMPYYLHQLDRVQGASHFEVTEEEGRCLIQKLTASIAGYAVPKYVREIAGEPHKTALI